MLLSTAGFGDEGIVVSGLQFRVEVRGLAAQGLGGFVGV